MKTRNRWVWDAYLMITLAFAIKSFYRLVFPSSEQFLYYFILRSFNSTFYLYYYAYVFHVLLNIIHCLPLFLFIYNIRVGNPDFWKLLFVLRCVFEVIGHSYGINELAAVYYSNPKFLMLASMIMIITHVPSYLACFWYAFRPEKAIMVARY